MVTTAMTPHLRVLEPGLYTTVQDLGRAGFQALGVPVAGALDFVGLRLANATVGNPRDAACLEVLYQGPTLEVIAEAVTVALAWGEAQIEAPSGGARRLPPWQSATLVKGERLRIGPLKGSSCGYLAVAGGFDLPRVMGSWATYGRGGIGGYRGRALAAGDALPLAEAAPRQDHWRLPNPPNPGLGEPIHVVLGPQADYFTPEALATLTQTAFAISPQADRMGLRLTGATLAHRDSYNIASDAIAPGAIQVPGNGQPIVLLADRHTAGGYPKIATVISADLPLLGRRRPGDTVGFARLEVEEAEDRRRRLETQLDTWCQQLEPVAGDGGIDVAALHRNNLISGVVDGRGAE
ncbi:MAG: biotin-dependent carboxyltransferase family protein [Candidatus Competibacterales bacterium]